MISMNPQMSLYDKYGHDGIEAVVNEFYNLLLNDPIISHYFEGSNLTTLRKHITLLLSYLLGSPEQWTGSKLRESHVDLSISNEDFERVINYLDLAMKKYNLDLHDRATILGMIRSLKFFIVQRRR